MEAIEIDMHDDAQAAQFFAVYEAAHQADTPDNPPPLHDHFLALGRQEHAELKVAFEGVRRDGELLGAGVVAMPAIDNTHLAQLHLWVHPHHRRRGVGSTLLERLTSHARADGRTILFAQAIGPVPGGPQRSDAPARFLEAAGFSPALTMLSRRVDMSTIDTAAEQALLDRCLPHAANYRTHTWTGHTPGPLAGGMAYLVNRVVTDAPRGELDIDQTTLDAQRLHTEEREVLDLGGHLVGAAAVPHDTGEVAAVAWIEVRPPGDHGFMRTTIAHPDHRGHRLGTIVKIEVHRRVRELFPQLRFVTTGNADTNSHMAAINEKLGYVVYQSGTNYQRRIDQATDQRRAVQPAGNVRPVPPGDAPGNAGSSPGFT